MTPPQHIVVVGAGLGGLRTIERLRSSGYEGDITLVGAEIHPPYDRPPLSKQVLDGSWQPDRTILRDRSGLTELRVTARLGSRAVGLHGTTVTLDSGEVVTGDAVVLATGTVARRLPGQPEDVATLRTLEDAQSLLLGLSRARSMIIVGAGFIGAEVACAARRRGLDVTVIEALPVPCVRVLGDAGGRVAARLFTEAGVVLRSGERIAGFKDGRTVELADGTVLSADIVLVSVGAVPDLDWLPDTLPRAADGLACDTRGRVAGTSDLWAVGDAAAWWDVNTGTHRRSEHWTSTIDQATRVACDILGTTPPAGTPEYVWSDQFGLKIQVLGRTEGTDEVVPLHGQGLGTGAVKGTVLGYFADGVLTGVASFGAPTRIMRYRTQIIAGADRDAVLAQAAEMEQKGTQPT
ncbi:NAD(P)/FAD-dependent oxidoreductase [Streptomyces sp. CB02414]|uniref:NAD(P)/FAD-dependent oxidoreductase n=1 Tax=Streptomyces sp. CB02414 TaxID=1703922 RepID=UPI00093B44F2|nr:FAD-dependent oxidoreductase [Streptomyces sp. CB02414]OKI86163.1 ferredoxin reductase [Streptomyces sp. CB02414]